MAAKSQANSDRAAANLRVISRRRRSTSRLRSLICAIGTLPRSTLAENVKSLKSSSMPSDADASTTASTANQRSCNGLNVAVTPGSMPAVIPARLAPLMVQPVMVLTVPTTRPLPWEELTVQLVMVQ